MMKPPTVIFILLAALALPFVGRAVCAQERGTGIKNPTSNVARDRTEDKERSLGNWTPCDYASLRRIHGNAAECFNLRLDVLLDKSAKESDELKIAFCLSRTAQLGSEPGEIGHSHYCARIRRGEIALAKVKAGTAERIGDRCAAKNKLNDGRPHTILLKRRKQEISVFLDDTIAVKGQDEDLSQGEIALGRVGDAIKVLDVKYQKVGEVHFSDDFMREGGPGTDWAKISGRWALSHVRNVKRSSNPFRCVGRGKGDALLIAGYGFWDDYTFEASAKCSDGGAFGIAFYYRNPKTYYVLRWNGSGMRASSPSDRGKLQILKVHESDRENDRGLLDNKLRTCTHVMAERKVSYSTGQWYRLGVKVSGQKAELFVDGGKVFEFSDPDLCAGKIGLYASQTNGAYFDDVAVKSNASAGMERQPIKLFSKVFENQDQMENWASIWSSWQPRSEAIPSRTGGGKRRVYWHRGDFFGDVSIGIVSNAIGSRRKSDRKGATLNTELDLLVGGDGRSVRKGYWLRVRSDNERRVLAFQLHRDMKIVAEKEVPIEALPSHRRVSLERQDDSIVAMLGGRAILSCKRLDTGSALNNTKIALWSNRDIELHKVEICSDDVYDYMFETAPVDWDLQLGEWKVTNRWTCDPSWSWLGGSSSQLAVMWSKRGFYGDMTVEFFAAFQMAKGEGYPSDINLTICGDGKNLDSGYSFIYAGWGNRWTRILKGDKIIAESDRFTINNRGLSNLFQLHRNWFHIKARKIGCRVQLYVNGALVREVIDPDPIEGGKIAIWTFGKGIIVSRARIYCAAARKAPLHIEKYSATRDFSQQTSGEEKREAVKSAEIENKTKAGANTAEDLEPSRRSADFFIFNDFEKDICDWRNVSGEHGASLSLDRARAAGGSSSLKLTNTHCGGDFGAIVTTREYDLRKFPLLMFDCNIPPAVKVNLYAKVAGTYYSVLLTGPRDDEDSAYADVFGPVVNIGKIDSVKADGKWHRAELDLLEALLKQGVKAEQKRLVVEEIAIGNLSNKDYLLCGFNGNPAGASYHIDNFGICRKEGTKR